MADDVLTKVEKQMEGTNLALAAVAEVLQKMDARLSTDEEVQIRKEEESQAQTERTVLVKEIAGEVALLLADAGLDVDGTKVRSAAKTGKAAGNADDAEKAVNIKSAIADQQATIQAMKKEEGAEEDEEELDTKGYKAEKGGYMKTHVPGHEEDEDEEPVEEGMEKEGDDAEKYPAEEEEDEDGEITAMAKQLKSMRKQIATQQKTMEKAITKETESRLRKMGFREENGLQRPQLTPTLGIDGATPIKKTDNVDTVDQLAGLSYKQLRDLQAQIEMGNTEGVPKELLGG